METSSAYLNKILSQAAKKNAILLHLTVGSKPQMKIGSQYVNADDSIVETETLEKIIEQVLTEKEMEKLQSGRELVTVKEIDKNLRFRINIYYQRSLPAITFYYVSDQVRSLQSLNFPPAIANFADAPSGLLIIAGNFGSGKTQTAASFIEEINKSQGKHIVTIEESIDRLFVSKESIVEQRQVGQDAPSFTDAIKYCLKEDLDLVFVNGAKEELDKCLIPIIELASGNSKVILEMNADSSVEIIDRLANILSKGLSPESSRYTLADNLFGIIVQKIIYGRGGEAFMAAEILIADPVVKSYIREGKFQQIESVIQTSKKEGMISMEKAINNLIQKGKISQQDL